MIPTVARATEEVLRLVPKEMRESPVALGATESRTIFRVVIPAAISGIVTGVMLALARVAGETAPLLDDRLWQPFLQRRYRVGRWRRCLYRFLLHVSSPYDEQICQAYAGSFVLMLLVIVTSLAVRWATGGFKQR